MVTVTTTKRKASGTYQRAWYYCPAAHTKGPTVCTHTKRYRKDVLELRLENRAVKEPRPKAFRSRFAVAKRFGAPGICDRVTTHQADGRRRRSSLRLGRWR